MRPLKAIILIGGRQKGTRFRPLSLELPKPLFPVAGFPMIYHHIEACSKVPGLREILLIGNYQPSESIRQFINNTQREFKIQVRYLQEYTGLGTAGGIYHFRDQILAGNPEAFFVLNGDICGDLPLAEMYSFHVERSDGSQMTLLGAEATMQESLNYGCLVENAATHHVVHYVEKPSTFVSTKINCGAYICSPAILRDIAAVRRHHQDENFSGVNGDGSLRSIESISLERDVFPELASLDKLLVFYTEGFWSQIKSPGSTLYANRHYLKLYHKTHPNRLVKNGDGQATIIGDVYIHPTAEVHPSATIGPNVSIAQGVTVSPGVRIRESIILDNATLQDHCCILYSIVGWNSVVGPWSRVEGTPCDPNPNKPFAKLQSMPLFNNAGKLNPSITILGSDVQVPGEVIVLNSIVLPHKDLAGSFRNQIIL
ncbi:PREDICTED: mannose-1-phosphate guanyltransferase alpha-A-like [Priapulus caudatus]|uniref:Mannose-1-phosphate guanyltransferase alpha-A-like n=1 Tax=Priapulus caudatus TaxID=37621 RepID=A0ABM1DRB5_PRICU|nr:PREDICTED: mannose-1-phosphate guanyltransferase alpha-A-like [Priapulus caudatus]